PSRNSAHGNRAKEPGRNDQPKAAKRLAPLSADSVFAEPADEAPRREPSRQNVQVVIPVRRSEQRRGHEVYLLVADAESPSETEKGTNLEPRVHVAARNAEEAVGRPVQVMPGRP